MARKKHDKSSQVVSGQGTPVASPKLTEVGTGTEAGTKTEAPEQKGYDVPTDGSHDQDPDPPSEEPPAPIVERSLETESASTAPDLKQNESEMSTANDEQTEVQGLRQELGQIKTERDRLNKQNQLLAANLSKMKAVLGDKLKQDAVRLFFSSFFLESLDGC